MKLTKSKIFFTLKYIKKIHYGKCSNTFTSLRIQCHNCENCLEIILPYQLRALNKKNERSMKHDSFIHDTIKKTLVFSL